VVTGRRLRWPTSIGTEAQGYLPERAAGLTPNLERRNLHSFISTSALVAAAGGSAAAVEAYAEMAELFWGRLVLRSEEQDEAAAEEAALQASMQRATTLHYFPVQYRTLHYFMRQPLLEQGGAPLGTPASECKPHVPRHPH
jgi:hypothetical protein